jgi:GNAT superfamily N-acetyltransferase
MIEIRPAVSADTPVIFQLIRDLAGYEKLLAEVEAVPDQIGAALFGAQPRAFCEIASWREPAGAAADGSPVGAAPGAAQGTDPGAPEQPAEIAGFALWFYTFSTFRGRHGLYLEDLFVRPQFRGRGIGKALLVNLAQRCERERLCRLEWQVLDWNEPSLRFYAALGAKAGGEWVPHRLQGDALRQLARGGPAGPAPPQS